AAGDPSLDACASASRSKTPAHLASPCRSCGPLASPTCHPSSLSQPALRRQTSEVRAACSNPARPDPCGGRQATDVPTPTLSKLKLDMYDFLGIILPGLIATAEGWILIRGWAAFIGSMNRVNGTGLTLLLIFSFGLGHIVQELGDFVVVSLKGKRYFHKAR